MSNSQILNIFSSFMQCTYESVGPSVTYGSGVYKKDCWHPYVPAKAVRAQKKHSLS